MTLPSHLTPADITWQTRTGATVHMAATSGSLSTWWCGGCATEGPIYLDKERALLVRAAQAHADGCSARRS
ncbi:hypothetical protein [Actinacidiphila yeochonensis]|uniref:hypothetical protein n=1 Tax=Actinacidiphila yeochonensis TaxID=89050 RepID=UPI000564D40D|nr:hypothetical protein [Actinacidiphila yeochonensis]